MEINSEIDLLDSDRLALNQVAAILRANVGKRRDIEAFVREITERIAEQGFVVDVRLYEDEDEDRMARSARTYYPNVVIVGRTEPQGEFDHERMGHEVRSDILGLRGENVQNTQVVGGFAARPSKPSKPGLPKSRP